MKMQNKVKEFLDKYNIHTNAEMRFIDLSSEIGELGKEILKGNNYGKKPHENSPALKDELGDCLFSLLALCNETGIDAENALQGALKKYAERFAQKGEISSSKKKVKSVVICGSMRFAKEQMRAAEDLELNHGYCVIQCIYGENDRKFTGKEALTLDKLHKQKIDMADAIYIVNIGGYIGASTRSEIEYAKDKGKEIMYHESCGDEQTL